MKDSGIDINSPETDFKAKELWEKMSPELRVKYLSYFQFWDGFSHYLYEYLPEDVRDRLRLKIAQNHPSWF
jgi:hypothetical protein